MPYQFRREPLTSEEAKRLANACGSHEEKLAIWTLLQAGFGVSELAQLRRQSLDGQGHRFMV